MEERIWNNEQRGEHNVEGIILWRLVISDKNTCNDTFYYKFVSGFVSLKSESCLLIIFLLCFPSFQSSFDILALFSLRKQAVYSYFGDQFLK